MRNANNLEHQVSFRRADPETVYNSFLMSQLYLYQMLNKGFMVTVLTILCGTVQHNIISHRVQKPHFVGLHFILFIYICDKLHGEPFVINKYVTIYAVSTFVHQMPLLTTLWTVFGRISLTFCSFRLPNTLSCLKSHKSNRINHKLPSPEIMRSTELYLNLRMF